MLFYVEKYNRKRPAMTYWTGCDDPKNDNPIAVYDQFLNGTYVITSRITEDESIAKHDAGVDTMALCVHMHHKRLRMGIDHDSLSTPLLCPELTS
jgi:hypothetical protein